MSAQHFVFLCLRVGKFWSIHNLRHYLFFSHPNILKPTKPIYPDLTTLFLTFIAFEIFVDLL